MEVVSIPTTLKRAIDFVKSKKEASSEGDLDGKLGEEIIQMESEETAEERIQYTCALVKAEIWPCTCRTNS